MVEVLTLLEPESESYGAFNADDVLVDENGSIRIATHPFTPGTATAAAELARRLARNADRPAARNRPVQAALLTALAQCAAGLAAGDLAAPLTELRRELDAAGADRERLTGELAALVAVPLVRVAAEPVAQPTSDPAPPVVTVVEPLPEEAATEFAAVPVLDRPPPLAPAGARQLPPRTVIVAIVVAVVALVAVLFAVLNGNSGTPKPRTSPPPVVHHGHANSPSPSVPAAANSPRPVHRPAPLAAGPISRVTLTPTGSCTAGAACAVTVKAWLRPPGLSQLTWHATLVDRCTGSTRPLESGAMMAEPGWHAPYTTVNLQLPQKSSMALLAVVDSPVSVSSRPLYVPAGGGSCG